MNIDVLATDLSQTSVFNHRSQLHALTELQERGLLIDDAVVARVAEALSSAFRRGSDRTPSNKNHITLAREALFPPKPDPFEVAAAALMCTLGFGSDLAYIKKWHATPFASTVEALRKAPQP